MYTDYFINAAITDTWCPYLNYPRPLQITVEKLTPVAAKVLGIHLGFITSDGDTSRHNPFGNKMATRFTADGRCKIKIDDVDTGNMIIVITNAGSAKELKWKLIEKSRQANTKPRVGFGGC